MRKKIKILLVDDILQAEGKIKAALSAIGLEPEITFCCPKDPEANVVGILPKGKELDCFDLALIDLELGDTPDEFSPEFRQLRGGSQVLPYLRNHAPWLPAIGYSYRFKDSSPRLLALAASYGFDACLPRKIFYEAAPHALDRGFWDQIFERGQQSRLLAAYGDGQTFPFEPPEIGCPDAKLRERLTKKFPAWGDIARAVFRFARKVHLEEMDEGFSGAVVLRAYADLSEENGSGEGVWVLKISQSPFKLFRELAAHHSIVRSGLEFVRSVQLLWRNVIRIDDCAAICYQFAHGTEEVGRKVRSGMVWDEIRAFLQPLFLEFYLRSNQERAAPADLARAWFNVSEIFNCSLTWKDCEAKKLLFAINCGESHEIAKKTIAFSRSRIHGDLHLGNILLGTSPVLIDFGRSNVGPIALDGARFVADLVVRFPELRATIGLPGFPLLSSNLVWGPFTEKCFLQNDGDKKLFNLFSMLTFASMLAYPDLDPDTKAWILSSLENWKGA